MLRGDGRAGFTERCSTPVIWKLTSASGGRVRDRKQLIGGDSFTLSEGHRGRDYLQIVQVTFNSAACLFKFTDPQTSNINFSSTLHHVKDLTLNLAAATCRTTPVLLTEACMDDFPLAVEVFRPQT